MQQQWTKSQLEKISGWDELKLRAEKAESLVAEHKATIQKLKRLKDPAQAPAEKPEKEKRRRKTPQYISRAKLETWLEENYTRTKPK